METEPEIPDVLVPETVVPVNHIADVPLVPLVPLDPLEPAAPFMLHTYTHLFAAVALYTLAVLVFKYMSPAFEFETVNEAAVVDVPVTVVPVNHAAEVPLVPLVPLVPFVPFVPGSPLSPFAPFK